MKINKIRKLRASLLVTFDTIALLITLNLLHSLRFNKVNSAFTIELFLITACVLAVMFLSGTYLRSSYSKPSLPHLNTFLKAISSIVPCTILVYILGPENFNNYFGRGILPIAIIIFGVIATLTRYCINKLYDIDEANTNILFLGDIEKNEKFLAEIKNNINNQKIYISNKSNIESDYLLTVPQETLLTDKRWHSIILDKNYKTNKVESDNLVRLRLRGTSIGSMVDYFENHLFKIPVTSIVNDWFIQSTGFNITNNSFTSKVKRIIDIISAVLILILSTPVILISIVLIKLESKGNSFYSQKRVGLNGKLFTIFKLRTMNNNAEDSGATWAKKNDPRVTKVGKFLRATRIDEIPQCWNILIGEMSLIGPRPERPEFTIDLSDKIPYYDLRHLVKPGLSGWAQVMYPYGDSEQDALKKLEYDLYYIKNQSLLLDLNIVLRTVNTVINRKGQ